MSGLLHITPLLITNSCRASLSFPRRSCLRLSLSSAARPLQPGHYQRSMSLLSLWPSWWNNTPPNHSLMSNVRPVGLRHILENGPCSEYFYFQGYFMTCLPGNSAHVYSRCNWCLRHCRHRAVEFYSAEVITPLRVKERLHWSVCVCVCGAVVNRRLRRLFPPAVFTLVSWKTQWCHRSSGG